MKNAVRNTLSLDNQTKSRKLHNPKANPSSVYIPCWLLQVPSNRVSHQAKILYGRLSQWSTENGQVYRSIPQLIREIGSNKSSIERTIKELKDIGLIGTYHPQKGGISHFEFYDHDWMHASIQPELSYYTHVNNDVTPTPKVVLPHPESGVTPTPEVVSINIKNINKHKEDLKPYVDFKKSTDCFEDHFEDLEKSDYKAYQAQGIKVAASPRTTFHLTPKSDYQNNQTKKETIFSEKEQLGEGENKPSLASNLNVDPISGYVKEPPRPRKPKPLGLSVDDLLADDPHGLGRDLLSDWHESRRAKKSPINHTAWTRAKNNMQKLKELGLDPIACFSEAVARGWSGVEVKFFSDEIAASATRLKNENEAKIREREERARIEKQREIEASKNFQNIVSQAKEKVSIFERIERSKREMESMGMNVKQYYHHTQKTNTVVNL